MPPLAHVRPAIGPDSVPHHEGTDGAGPDRPHPRASKRPRPRGFTPERTTSMYYQLYLSLNVPVTASPRALIRAVRARLNPDIRRARAKRRRRREIYREIANVHREERELYGYVMGGMHRKRE